ncbi:hypothetical protein BHM03_00046870 [Ensete ventricosum]|nr:hypothetical protein BHM03_00046870 [Ensete ventricosum]
MIVEPDRHSVSAGVFARRLTGIGRVPGPIEPAGEPRKTETAARDVARGLLREARPVTPENLREVSRCESTSTKLFTGDTIRSSYQRSMSDNQQKNEKLRKDVILTQALYLSVHLKEINQMTT